MHLTDVNVELVQLRDRLFAEHSRYRTAVKAMIERKVALLEDPELTAWWTEALQGFLRGEGDGAEHAIVEWHTHVNQYDDTAYRRCHVAIPAIQRLWPVGDAFDEDDGEAAVKAAVDASREMSHRWFLHCRELNEAGAPWANSIDWLVYFPAHGREG